MSSPSTNRWCERLGLASTPRPEDLVGRRDVKLFHLMIVALLEEGRPMTIDEIAGRLAAAGVVAPSGDLRQSLQKAWHGLEPVYRDATGRYGIQLDSRELDLMLFIIGLRGPRGISAAPPPVLPPDPGDDVPLDEHTLDAAFRGRGLSGLSLLRQAAAVLDAQGEPMQLQAVELVLAGLTPYRAGLRPEAAHAWRSTLVRISDGDVLTLDRSAPELADMRRDVRKRARVVLEERARAAHFARIEAERTSVRERERSEQREGSARLCRAVLRVVPEPGAPYAAALLDLGSRTIETFVGDEVRERLRERLGDFDVLAGLYVWDTLAALQLDQDAWRLADLKPPRRTRRLNSRGRTLTLTADLLIAGTLETSRPLGDPAVMAGYLASGSIGRLRRRLESDVKALATFYRYGALHGCVRLRWGFLDEMIPVDWTLPGEPMLYELLAAADQAGAPVDVVLGRAPGWSDPWARARRFRVVDTRQWDVVALDDGVERRWVDRREIQAIRFATSG